MLACEVPGTAARHLPSEGDLRLRNRDVTLAGSGLQRTLDVR